MTTFELSREKNNFGKFVSATVCSTSSPKLKGFSDVISGDVNDG